MGLQEPTGAQLVVVEEPPQEADDLGVVLLVGCDQQHASFQKAEVLSREGGYLQEGCFLADLREQCHDLLVEELVLHLQVLFLCDELAEIYTSAQQCLDCCLHLLDVVL